MTASIGAIVRASASWGAIALACCGFVMTATPRSASGQIPPAVELRVPQAPTVAANDAGAFAAYEIHVTNFTGAPLLLRSVEVLDARDKTLATIQDSALLRLITRPGVNIPLA